MGVSIGESSGDPKQGPTGERRLIVLGSTGSIGRQTLDVVAHLNALHARGQWPTHTRVVGLAAGRNAGLLAQQAEAFGVTHTALADEAAAPMSGDGARKILRGPSSALELVRAVPCDMVVAAMVGSAGLPATLAAVELGRDVALANKETLVAAGALVVPAAQRSGSRLLPVDSEHSALWQCLRSLCLDARAGTLGAPPFEAPASVSRAVITASGGPFRAWSKDRIAAATPDEALRHPTWNMGDKISVDSASMMNKALEIIEAHWLFGLDPDRISALVHPQSIVHAIVELADGSCIAQLGAPDMRTPIQYALTFPHRPPGCSRKLDLAALRGLEFEPIDLDRFPAIDLAYDAIRAGGTAGAILNAANEAAVEVFLAARRGNPSIRFGRISELVSEALATIQIRPMATLADCLDADAESRQWVRRHAV